MRSKTWCFTYNNYSEEDVTRILDLYPAHVKYIIFGREVGASGTPHLQGTVIFLTRKRLNQVTALIGAAHVSVTANLPRSIEYCKKDGDFEERGTPEGDAPASNHARNGNDEDSKMDAFKESVKSGTYDMKTLRELHSEICASYPRFVIEYVNDHRPRHTVTPHPLREWQSELYSKLILPPDPRSIYFIVDVSGNAGKSWFARYYAGLHDNAQIIIPGKKADMALVVREDAKVFFFDCPRSKQGDFLQYDFLEELKNGFIFSPKYQSVNKSLETPHVVVLMNERPDMEKLSRDRYKITILD